MTTGPLRPAESAADWQQNGKGGSLPRLAENTDGAAVAPHNAKRRREAKSSAQKLGGEEGLEDATTGLSVHAGAGIGHVDAHVVAGGDGKSFSPGPLPPLAEMLGPHPHRQGAGLVSDRLAAVDHQVHEQLLNLRPVRLDNGAVIGNVEDQSDLLGDRGANEGTDLA